MFQVEVYFDSSNSVTFNWVLMVYAKVKENKKASNEEVIGLVHRKVAESILLHFN